MLGMGNKSLTSGSAAVRIPIHQPMARPSAVPGINAIRKEAMSLPRVVPAWSHNSPPAARPKSVLTIFVGGGKKAARKKPAWTRTSQAASATRLPELGINRTASTKVIAPKARISKSEYKSTTN